MTGVLGTELVHSYGTNELKLLSFAIGDVVYAVNIAKVRESISLKDYPLIPISVLKVQYLMGALNVRDEIIFTVDLPTYLNQKCARPYDERMGIIVEYDGQKIAYMVDEIRRNLNFSWKNVFPPPQNLGDTSVVTGFVLDNLDIIQLLDFEKIRYDLFGSLYQFDAISNVETGPIQVLYAEDSAHVRKVVTSVLEKNNIRVTSCENGEVAWREYKARPEAFSFVISDIEMPLKDGTSLTADIRSHPKGSEIPIFLMSSMTIEQNIEQYLKIGASAFIPKNRMDELNKLIHEYTNNSANT